MELADRLEHVVRLCACVVRLYPVLALVFCLGRLGIIFFVRKPFLDISRTNLGKRELGSTGATGYTMQRTSAVLLMACAFLCLCVGALRAEESDGAMSRGGGDGDHYHYGMPEGEDEQSEHYGELEHEHGKNDKHHGGHKKGKGGKDMHGKDDKHHGGHKKGKGGEEGKRGGGDGGKHRKHGERSLPWIVGGAGAVLGLVLGAFATWLYYKRRNAVQSFTDSGAAACELGQAQQAWSGKDVLTGQIVTAEVSEGPNHSSALKHVADDASIASSAHVVHEFQSGTKSV